MGNNLLDDHFIEKKPIRFKYTLFYIWIFVYMIGAFFKISHWPFANLLIVFGSAGFLSHALIGFLFYKVKDKVVLYFLVIGILQIVRIVYGVFYRNGKPLNINGLAIFIVALLIILLIEYLFFRKNRIKNNF